MIVKAHPAHPGTAEIYADAIVEAAQHYQGFFGPQVTAAGSMPPARVLVIGAGVAGLAAVAAAKALGTGFRRGVFFSDLGVVNLPSGQPTLQMTGGAAERLAAITPAGMNASVALTMTDEYPYAFAQVIISAVPAR